MRIGRPTKYESRYVEDCIDFMGERYSLTAFAGNIGVARWTVNERRGAPSEFQKRYVSARRTGPRSWSRTFSRAPS